MAKKLTLEDMVELFTAKFDAIDEKIKTISEKKDSEGAEEEKPDPKQDSIDKATTYFQKQLEGRLPKDRVAKLDHDGLLLALELLGEITPEEDDRGIRFTSSRKTDSEEVDNRPPWEIPEVA